MSLRRQLILSLLLLVVAVLTAVAVYMYLGGPGVTLLDAVYMAVITITTVGYGEIVDTHANPALRLFNIFFVLIGIGIMLYVFSVSTAFIVQGELNDFFRRRKMMKQIRDMNDHLIICGAGETGTYLVKELLKTGEVFVVIDHDEERLERMGQLGDVPVLKGTHLSSPGTPDGIAPASRLRRRPRQRRTSPRHARCAPPARLHRRSRRLVVDEDQHVSSGWSHRVLYQRLFRSLVVM